MKGKNRKELVDTDRRNKCNSEEIPDQAMSKNVETTWKEGEAWRKCQSCDLNDLKEE